MDYGTHIKDFIVDNFLFGKEDSLEYTTDFFDNGIIDSTGILELISFIEEEYDLSVKDDELVPENFSSIEKVNNYLNMKKASISKAG